MVYNYTVFSYFYYAFTTQNVTANTVLIAGYLSPAPLEVTEPVAEGGGPRPHVGGVKVLYSGYSNFTNNDGYFSIPKHHGSDKLRIVVTTQVGYEMLKNTVSHQKTVASTAPMAVYTIAKYKESDRPSQKKVTDGASLDPNQWYWQVTAQGNTLENGLTSHDLVIVSDPKHIYIQDASIHYCQEHNQFIIPQNLIFVVTTPDHATITKDDQFVQSVDASEKNDTIEQAGSNDEKDKIERTIVHGAAVA